ncbi:ECF RNA polymerase sigma factor SigK [Cryptosporangium sp. NPDC048952]|uniref:ECF RNA polymerase sigma factor SigK n=1 Tax=Cryptosporangium sp. NPDC048952 TaxID=3363961 RepID=UPI00370FEB51
MDRWRRARATASPPDVADTPDVDVLGALLIRVGRGDDDAFARLYDEVSSRVYGVILRVVRDSSQAEEVAQEVFVEIWRTATRFDAARGTASGWVLTLAHRRAVDRVRAAQAATDREKRASVPEATAYDVVVDEVAGRLEQQQVRRCLRNLTDVQREAITLAYYGGQTYREVAVTLDLALPTVKTRMRDGLIRLRDCLGVGR